MRTPQRHTAIRTLPVSRKTLGGEWLFLLILAGMIFSLPCISSNNRLQGQEPEKKQRVIYVPFEDLEILFDGDSQHVFLSRAEYDDLLKQSKKVPVEDVPLNFVYAVSNADVEIKDSVATIQYQLTLDLLKDEMFAVPIKLQSAAIQSARLDGESAPLGRDPNGTPVVFVAGSGRHKLELRLVAPLNVETARQSVQFELPSAATASLKLAVPGNVELTSGPAVLSRVYDSDADVTNFDLIPPRAATKLAMTVNNRRQQAKRSVLAKSVFIHELTSDYEQIHARINVDILHGSIDQVEFELPADFQILEVSGSQLAQWSIESTDEAGAEKKTLIAQLRETTSESFALNIAAMATSVRPEDWTLRQLKPKGFTGSLAVVGVVAEERFELQSLSPTGLIFLDNQQIQNSIPQTVFKTATGAPAIATVAAFYAPDHQFELKARFKRPPARLNVVPTSVLFLSDRNQKLIGQYQLVAENEKIIDVDLVVPQDWRVTRLTGAGGAAVKFQRFQTESGTRLNVEIPGGLIPGNATPILFEARKTSSAWARRWSQIEIDYPRFEVAKGEMKTGAIAVVVEDDLTVRATETRELETLLKEQKSLFDIEEFNTSIAFEVVSGDYAAKLAVERLQPQVTATTYSFLKLQTKQLSVHYEITFDIQVARGRELQFQLPDSSPGEIQIRGLQGLTIAQSGSEVKEGQRIWTIELTEPRLGEVRVAVDFLQPLESEEPQDLSLPIIEALNVNYQTALVAFEGNPDFDISIETGMRSIDVGEMGDADYIPGARLQGAYSAVGEDSQITIDVQRRDIHALPAAIIQNAWLKTIVARNGKSQTQATYQLLTRVPFVELKLPGQAKLWGATFDGVPTRPQLRDGAVLISLPPDNRQQSRELRLFFEHDIDLIGLAGQVQMDAPALRIRSQVDSDPIAVPQANLEWTLTLPSGYAIASNDGTVFTTLEERRPLPVENVAAALSVFLQAAAPKVARDTSASMEKKADFKRSPDYASDEEFARNGRAMLSRRPSAEAGGEAEGQASPMDGKFDDAMESQPFGSGVDKAMNAGDPAPATTNAPAPDPFGAEAPTGNRTSGLAPGSASGRQRDGELRLSGGRLDASGPGGGDGGPGTTSATTGSTATGAAKAPPPASTKLPKKKLIRAWSRKGMEGLDISSLAWESDTASSTYEFHSLGAEPNVTLTIVDQDRLHWFSFAYGCVVIALGLVLCRRSLRVKIVYLSGVVLIAAIVPMFGDWTQVVWRGLENSLLAAVLLVAVYVVFAILSVIYSWSNKTILGWSRLTIWTPVLLVGSLGMADGLAAQNESTLPSVQIPPDAIIVPYDPENPAMDSEQIFVPYKRYVELYNLANPDQKLDQKPLPAEFGLAGAKYQTTLDGSELIITGSLEITPFTDKKIAIPLDLERAIITKATVDGKPASLQVIRLPDPPQTQVPNVAAQSQQADQGKLQGPAPPAQQLVLFVEGQEKKNLNLELRLPLDQAGGWRTATARIPHAVASEMKVDVADEGTEVSYQIAGIMQSFVATAENNSLTLPLGPKGELAFSFRGQVTAAKIDQNLSLNSTALFDVRNDGLHLVWKLDFLFRASKRDKFDVELPKDFSVVRVYGNNIRGWEVRDEEAARILDVALLTEADSKESFTVELANRSIDLAKATSFPMPTVVIPDAAIHSGQITVRKSDQLELQTDTMIGISRIDIAEASQVRPQSEPLFQPTIFQAFEFSRTPFSVAIRCRPQKDGLEVFTQSLIDIRQKSCGLETRFNLATPTPRHVLELKLPAELEVQTVNVPVPFRRAIERTDEGQRLRLFLAEGLRGNFVIDVAGRLPDHEATGQINLPSVGVTGASQLSGEITAVAEPQLNVQPEALTGCESILVSKVKSWLIRANQTKARLAIRHPSGTFDGQLKVSRKPPVVEVTSITNVNVTLRSIEESLILNYDIRDAGIDTISFLIPARLKDAVLKADLIQEKTLEPVGANADTYRVTLKLQDFVIGQYRVLLEQDLGLTNDKQYASIPEVENAASVNRYVTLQNSGFDELVVPETVDLENLDRRQKPFRNLRSLIGGADIRRAYVVSASAENPRLAYQTNPRKLVETVGASIGLSEIRMSIDRSGAFRGEQKLFVDNRTEPFLEIELPTDARLWTVTVAGSPVKPISTTASDRVVRIPLVKTADGDTDFEVELKYGGRTEPLSNLSKIDFPFVRTRNISVASTNVRLFLPEDFDFYWFDGTLGKSEEKEIDQATSAYESALYSKLQSKATQSKSDLVRQRAIQNLKNLGNDFQVETESSNEALSIDNRARFNDLLERQETRLFGNSGNLSNTYGRNFGGQKTTAAQQGQRGDENLNEKWFDSNGLINPDILKQNEANQRFNAPGFQQNRSGQGQGGGRKGGGGKGDEFKSKDDPAKPQGQTRAELSLDKLIQNPTDAGFKKQIADNLNVLQEQSRQNRRAGNKRGEVLRKYREQLDRESTLGRDSDSRQPILPPSQQPTQELQMGANAGVDSNQLVSPDESVTQFERQGGRATASLDLEFEHRGKQYLFQAPSGDLQLQVTVVSQSLKRRTWNFLILFGVVGCFGVVLWATRRRKV